MIPIYIGYDPKEKEAFSVLSYSLLKYASEPISIIPLKKELFNGFYYREKHPLQSTEFSFTRFLVPYLNKFTGWAIYMDCDMLCKQDIANLWKLRDNKFSIMVVPHNYEPSSKTKMDNQIQTKYKRKNWSSMILFNCYKCSILTPELIQYADGLYLHQFQWLEDLEIGTISNSWNYLVGESKYNYDNPLGIIHYTLGGPWLEEYKNNECAIDWFYDRDEVRGLI